MARLCNAGVQLRAEINARWPNRDRASDGWIGDPAHASRRSDHNPNSAGVVRALDIDKDGVEAGAIVEHLRKMGKSGDRRLVGGYLIWQNRIAGTHTNWNWHVYNGSNPHTMHFHVSFADYARDYDASGSWGVSTAFPQADVVGRTPQGDRILGLYNPPLTGQDVYNVQTVLIKLGNRIPHDGVYSKNVSDIVTVFKKHRFINERGVGEKAWAALRKEIHGG